jgi:hypothetical protein
MKELRLIVLACILATAASSPLRAAPLGLVIIPTADILEPGQYLLELETFGKGFPPRTFIYQFLNTQFGITEHLDAGVDLRMSSSEVTTEAMFNWKYAFPAGGIDLAVGTASIGRDQELIHYLVSNIPSGDFVANLGIQHSNRKAGILVGGRYQQERYIVMADYTGDRDFYSSVGFNYLFSNTFDVQLGVLFPNNGDEEQYLLNISYSGLFN